MKERFINWILNKLLSSISRDDVLGEALKEKINMLIFKLYEISNYPHILDREIIAMTFNAKYTDKAKAMGITLEPSKVLTKYYQLANKGDNSFMKEPFYRLLSQSKDGEVRKLRYRLKITQ